MVKIRLTRTGKKNAPSYRIVVMDARVRRDGAYIEKLGHYAPLRDEEVVNVERAEYWCYITDYEETYCITALEMQYAKVIPVATKVAALDETIKSGIICDSTDETNWNSAILSIGKAGPQIKEKVIESNYNWAKCQTWNQRSYDWKNLLEKLTHE